MNLVDELHAIAAALRSTGVRYAVCGGVAVSAHGAPRSTKDLEIVVAPEDVERVLEAVRPLGYKFPALSMTFDAGTERERNVQRVSKIEGPDHMLLDVLLANASLAGALDDRLGQSGSSVAAATGTRRRRSSRPRPCGRDRASGGERRRGRRG